MPKIKDRKGIRYGHLIVIEFSHMDYNIKSNWLCKCDCGKEIIITGNNLRSGNTKSCGCFQKRKNHPRYIHGKCINKSKESTIEIKALKEKIRKRDNYTCQKCNKTQGQNIKEFGRKLDVHHIDGNNTNNVEENMITLCYICHLEIRREVNITKLKMVKMANISHK